MKKDTITEEQAKKSPAGGVLVGKRQGQTIIHDKGTEGGYFVGKLHKEGGIKGINKSTGQPIEVQGGEVIITAPAVADQTKREFEGQMLTNREILSKINEKGGGVSLENGGEIYYNGSSYNYGGKTMTDYEIMQSMNDCGCEDEYDDGGMFNTQPFLNYYFDEIAEFLKYQNDITLNKDFTFNYKGELFRIEPIVLSEKNIKEAYFSIIDSEDDEVGEIKFNPNDKKQFFAYSRYFEWNNRKFDDGGEIKKSEQEENGKIEYFINKRKVGFLDYIFDEKDTISENLSSTFNNEMYIDYIEVDKEFRNLGIAKKLINKAIDIAKDKKIEVITLRRDSGMGSNYGSEYDNYLKNIYQKNGFQDFPDNEEEENTAMYYVFDKNKKFKNGGYVSYKDKYNVKFKYPKGTSHDLEEISKDTGVSIKGLQQIYNKGIGAYKTNPESVRPNVKSKEQWAMARVYSAVIGGKASKVDSNELKMNNGGNLDLSKQSKKGDHPARDLNNYNDVLDVEADGMVGSETGLFADGGDLKPYDANMDGDSADTIFKDGGATLSAKVFEWDKVPTNYRNISKVKKVPFTNNPLDKGLDSIVTPFLGKDDLRQSMSGINFDENGITGTNAHILITLPYPNKKYEGIYDVNKAKKTKSNELLLINEKYPNYEGVIPKSENSGIPYLVDVYKLLQYTKTAMNYANKTTHAIAFKYGDDNKIGFNGKLLVQVLTTALKLGHEKIYAFIHTSRRAIILSPNKNYELGNDELLLTMPVILESNGVDYIDGYGTNDPDYNRSIKAYFDFNDSEIHNADGSVAEFKMQYENNLSVDDDYLALLSKITTKRNKLPILDYAKVEDGKMTATDLEISLVVKNVNMPNGIYEIVNKAPNITMNPIEDFPSERVFNKDEYETHWQEKRQTAFEFVTFSEVFEFYLDKLLLSVGNDDLRPVMSGICIKKTWKNELFLVTTNAHVVCKVNITEYCEFNKDDRELEFILPVDYLKDFVKLADGSLHFKCSKASIFIESDNLEYIARAIDGKYPNYEAVIPKQNNKMIVFDHAQMNKCLKSKEYQDLIAKYKGQKNISFTLMNSEDKFFVRVKESTGNRDGKILEELILCDIDFNFKNVDKYFTESESLFLLMPVMENLIENQYFAFAKYYFDVMLKTITDTEVECYFTEPNRAYLFPIDAIDYKKTLPVEKTKQQKLSKKDLEQIAELEDLKDVLEPINEVEPNELQEAIETLEMLMQTAKGKDKKDIKEALEIIKMLNENN
jgi:DNA polymerase III sliding clamp (beta) subunit (PCNA family)/ribosomal protein S18 acetylase RimI-like enzyme